MTEECNRSEELPILHIHAQEFWHRPAFICGSSEALQKINFAIETALANSQGKASVILSCNDGESYELKIHCINDAEVLARMQLPYTDSD